MRNNEIHDFFVDLFIKTLPGAVGSVLYYLLQLGPVAIITIAWVGIQIYFFLLDRYRKEKARNAWMRSRPAGDESTYPGDA